MTIRILSVVGARPQFIKAAVLTRVLAQRNIPEVMIHTGQHFDAGMSDVFFAELGIPEPAYHLGISGGGHGEMAGRMMQAIEPIMVKERPDVVLVYGDTNSTIAAALCGAKLQIPVAHVEAGLRSFDRTMPEEHNRVVADHVSEILLCPTSTAVRNLEREGIKSGVHRVGDVMFDASLYAKKVASDSPDIVQALGLKPKAYAVATVHRAGNTDDPANLKKLMDWLDDRAGAHPVILPLHPRTRQAMERAGMAPRSVRLLDPLGYFDMATLLSNSVAIYTDSGGVQKEAYFYRVPCVTLRPNTEWVETIEAGWNRLWQGPDHVTPRREINDYGDGHAGERIVDILLRRA